MKKRYVYPPLLCLLLGGSATAQYLQVNDNYTAQQLVNTLVDNSCAQISNIQVSGASGVNSFGFFSAGTSGFPFGNGIVLSTGYAASVPGPNGSLLSEGPTSWAGDQDMENALSINNTVNATVLEFDFTPFTDRISFDYIFASEQYLTSITSQNQCNYTDGFAFLIKEASTNNPYQNLAVVPGTDIPVKVNTVRGEGVCPSANEQYFGGFNDFNNPINFNGQTVILTAQTNVTPGALYHIKLVVADQGNNLYDSAIFLGGGSFRSAVDLGPDRLVSTGNPLCTGEQLTINAANPVATGYKWYKNGTLIPGATSSQYTVTSPGDYSVAIQLSPTCTVMGEIKAEYVSLPATGNFSLLQCDDDNDGISAFNLNLANEDITNADPSLFVQFFTNSNDADSGTNPIINSTAYLNSTNGQVVYARVTNQYGCYAVSSLTLLTTANGMTNPDLLTACDEDGNDDGFTPFDLTLRTAQILQNLPAGLQLQYFTSEADALAAINPILSPQSFINTIEGGQTIYARVHNGSECYGLAQFPIDVFSFGSALDDEKVILCKDNVIRLDVGSGFSSYSWNILPVQNTQAINVSQPGNYTVTVTSATGCVGTKTFIVVPSESAFDADFIINDFTGNQNSITILPEGIGDYEFSLDGNRYQYSNVFTDLLPGKYTVYINDKNGCGEYTDVVYVLDYPKFFTPNGDNVNDVWRIQNLTFLPDTQVTVFDRYGKVITRFKGSSVGWDGTYNGRLLAASDYWFVIELESGRIIKGHFSLLR